ncbi:MAG: alpha-amylase family glycosyl hydrolase [Verrucomicrobiota bacterium]
MNPLRLFSTIIVLACSLALAPAEGLRVDRVEPPNWWAGHSHNPVRLLLSGTNLTGAQLSAPAGFHLSNVVVNATGTHAFCDLFIPADAAPGERRLLVNNSAGAIQVPFAIAPALPRAGRFAGFSPDDVLYLVMTDRFANGDTANDNPAVSPGLLNRAKPRDYHGGDFQGVINRLPYLRDLGITALWLTPWYDNVNHANTKEKYTRDNQRSPNGVASTDYHGYGAVDFYGVEERFGDMTKLQELITTAQASGFKFIQDQVANHTGPYHPWAKQPPTPTWFNGTPENHLDNSWQIWTIAATNPPPDKLKSTLEGWFINVLPDLNQNDPETATYLIQNSLWWIGMTGLDVVRQDTLPYVPRSYWAKWTAALKKEYPHLTILGELWDAKPELVAFFQGGRKQFDGVDSGVETLFDFPLYYAMRDVFAKRQSMTKLAQTLAADTNYVDTSNLVTFLGLHDTARFMSESGATIEGLQLAFTYLLTTRGTPLIYYGDEIAMNGGGDPHNRRDFPGGWAEDQRNAFEATGRTPTEERVHAHVKKLLALRRELEPLRRGELVQLASEQQTSAFARVTKDCGVIVAFNNSDQTQTIRATLVAPLLGQKELFDRLAPGHSVAVTSDTITLTLPARSAAILTADPPTVAAEHGKRQARSDLR